MRTAKDILGDMNFETFSITGSRDPAFWIERMSGEIIKPFHIEWIEMARKNERTMIIAPTGHGKTLILGIWFPLWICFYNRKKEILVVSKTEPQAKGILERIRNLIEDNEFLQFLEPKNKSDTTWSKTELVLSNKCKVFSKPYNENIASFHVDYLISDEVAKYKDNLAQGTVFERYVMTRVTAKKGKLVGITTVVHGADLSMKLKSNPLFVTKVYPAIINAPPDDIFKGKAIFPELYPIEKLKQIKESIGSLAFDREYLCNTHSSEDALITPEMVIDAWDEDLEFSYNSEGENVYIGVDFAVSSGKDADYFVITVIESNGDKFYIKHIERHKGMPISAQKKRLLELNNIFKPVAMRLDETNYGVDVVQELRQNQVPVVGQKFDHTSRRGLLLNLRRIFEGKMLDGKRVPTIIIPRKPNSNCTILTDQLFVELTSIVPKKTMTGLETFVCNASHDDMIFSLGMALNGATVNKGYTGKVFYT